MPDDHEFKLVNLSYKHMHDIMLSDDNLLDDAWAVFDSDKCQLWSLEADASESEAVIDFIKSSPGRSLFQAPKFIPENYDTFNWDKIKETLDQAKPGVEDDDTVSVYLGSVFSITPSGKFYAPFACSNVTRCSFCKGSGKLDNPFSNLEQIEIIKQRRSELTDSAISRFGLYYMWPADIKEEAAKLDHERAVVDPTYTCSYCNGVGSREAMEDSLYNTYLEQKAESIGGYITNGDGDGDSIFIVRRHYADA